MVFIDPGAALAPRRFGLPPHPCEEGRLGEVLGVIRERLLESHVAVVTHYHYDHYLYRIGEEEYYHRGLVLAVKHPESSINASQRVRAWRLLRRMGVGERVARLVYADGGVLEFEDVVLRFSPPVPHGERGTPLGYVVMVGVEADGVRFVHASDVQGPGDRAALEWIVGFRPDVVVLSGPPLYLEGGRVASVERMMGNLFELVSRLPRGSTLVVDHHFVRDGVPGVLGDVRRVAAARGVRVVTCAEFMGVEPRVLEAERRELWRGVRSC